MTRITATKLARSLVLKDNPTKIVARKAPANKFWIDNPNPNSCVKGAYVSHGELVNWQSREKRWLKKHGVTNAQISKMKTSQGV